MGFFYYLRFFKFKMHFHKIKSEGTIETGGGESSLTVFLQFPPCPGEATVNNSLGSEPISLHIESLFMLTYEWFIGSWPFILWILC